MLLFAENFFMKIPLQEYSFLILIKGGKVEDQMLK